MKIFISLILLVLIGFNKNSYGQVGGAGGEGINGHIKLKSNRGFLIVDKIKLNNKINKFKFIGKREITERKNDLVVSITLAEERLNLIKELTRLNKFSEEEKTKMKDKFEILNNSYESKRKELKKIDLELFEYREVIYPKFIPEPPPSPSARMTFSNLDTFSIENIHRNLVDALENNGYYQRTYFVIENGFVIMSQMEQINEEGEPLSNENRWSLSIAPIKQFTIKEYLQNLIFPQKGKFRVFLFWVSLKPCEKIKLLGG